MRFPSPAALRRWLRGWQGSVVRRRSDGSLVLIDSERGEKSPPDTEAPVGTVPGKES